MAGQPKYAQVADVLRREIAEGIFPEGKTLTTEEELRFRFGVSRQTVRQAIALLEDDGLVDRRRGSGTYVRHGPRKRQGLLRVGVLTSYITDYISPAILSGIEAVMNRNGVVMSLSATANDPVMERNILERMIDGQVDGLLIEGCRTAEGARNRDCYQRLAERNIPVVFLNAGYAEMPSIPCVEMDDEAGGRQAAELLIRRGYTRPGGVFKTDDLQGARRMKGFVEALAGQGLTVPSEHLFCFDTGERMTWLVTERGQAFLSRVADGLEMDSLVCYNDIFAVNLMRELQGRGMRLPQQLGVIGFDNAPAAAMMQPGLTTLGHPQEAFGALAAEKLLRMLNGEKESGELVPWQLIERESLPERLKR